MLWRNTFRKTDLKRSSGNQSCGSELWTNAERNVFGDFLKRVWLCLENFLMGCLARRITKRSYTTNGRSDCAHKLVLKCAQCSVIVRTMFLNVRTFNLNVRTFRTLFEKCAHLDHRFCSKYAHFLSTCSESAHFLSICSECAHFLSTCSECAHFLSTCSECAHFLSTCSECGQIWKTACASDEHMIDMFPAWILSNNY